MLEIVKKYLNIDFDDDDILISGIIDSGKEYLKNAGVVESENNKALYQHTLCLWVIANYGNRENDKMNLYISNLINQLRLVQDV